MIEPGTYKGIVQSYALGGLDNGKEHVAVVFVLPELGAQTLTWYGYLHTEKIFPHTIKALKALGWKGADISDLSSIADAEASLVVENEEYNGVVSPRIKWVNRPGGVALQPADAVEAKKFAASIKARIVALDQSPKVSGKPKPKAKVESDIPF